jgi:pimeloyl-ACP methyl ester carboxylesterase
MSPLARDLFAAASDRFFVDANVDWAGQREVARARLTLWGRGPAIYLLHGWGGRGSQFASFVKPLTDAGLTAVLLDAPGHGEVPARGTSLYHFAAVLAAAVESCGPARCVIGHSLGGAALAVALRWGMQADRVVLIGTPRIPGATFRHFLDSAGIDRRLHDRVSGEVERQFGFRFDDLTVRPPADRPALPAMLVHDRDDGQFGYEEASKIARDWPGAKVVTTHGNGHFRILRNRGVIEQIVAFASSGRADCA